MTTSEALERRRVRARHDPADRAMLDVLTLVDVDSFAQPAQLGRLTWDWA